MSPPKALPPALLWGVVEKAQMWGQIGLLECQPCHFLAGWPWASPLTSLDLSFLLCEMGMENYI